MSSKKDGKSLEIGVSPARRWQFGPFTLDAVEGRLWRDGRTVELTPKALALLVFLIERRDRLVTRRELLDALWPDCYVDEANVTGTVWMIRRALDGSGWIETRPKRGYRFVGEVRETGEGDAADRLHARRTLAVLPLRPLQPGHADEVLEIGVADTLITRLGSMPGIMVRPVSAVRAHRGAEQDPLAVGRRLGADVILEGTIQRDGDAVRVNVRLLTIPDGTLIWAQAFDVPFTGIFAVEDAIAEHVASALSTTLTAQERTSYARRHIPPVEAYRLYLEGRNHWHAWPSPGYEQSRACFENAIALDPEYAQAYVGLAHYFGLGAAMGLLRPADAWPQLETATATALHLDASLGETYNAVAATQLYVRHDWPAAEEAFRQALAINSNDAETRNHYGFSLALFGRTDAALDQIDQALRVDPLASRFRRNRAFVLYQAGRYDDAIKEAERLAELDSAYTYVFELLGDAYEQTGTLGEALAQWARADSRQARPRPRPARAVDRASFEIALRRLWQPRLAAMMRRRAAGEFVPAMQVARAHARMGRIDDALIWIEKASYERNRLILELPRDPHFDPLRSHARFQQVLAGLPNSAASR